MKKVFKTSSDFFCYFKASDSHCEIDSELCIRLLGQKGIPDVEELSGLAERSDRLSPV